MIETILTALISGAFTGIITVVTMRRDIEWIKNILAEHGERITFVERNI